jgi:hypothetical protein
LFPTAVGGGEFPQLVESPGTSTPGNTFKWDEATQRWAFNLSTKPYTAAGTDTVTAVAGAEDYALAPICSGTFERR